MIIEVYAIGLHFQILSILKEINNSNLRFYSNFLLKINFFLKNGYSQ